VGTLGPVEYVIFGFPGGHGTGALAPAIAELIDSGTVRLLDVIFVRKNRDGDLSLSGADAFEDLASTGLTHLAGEMTGVMSDEDVIIASEVLDPGTSAVLVVWEHIWAERAARAARDVEGEVVAGEVIPRRVVERALASVAAG
jgi:uncharacterized membrane protein